MDLIAFALRDQWECLIVMTLHSKCSEQNRELNLNTNMIYEMMDPPLERDRGFLFGHPI